MTTNNLPVMQEARQTVADILDACGWKGVVKRLREGVVFPSDAPEELACERVQRAMNQAAEAERAEMQKAVDYYAGLYAERCGQLAIAAEAEREWRPIETAPKDGTEILAYSEHGCTGTLLVRHIALSDFLTSLEIEEMSRSGVGDETLDEADWFFADFLQGDRLPPDCAPTHWQPLPKPPAIRTLPTEIEGEGR